MGLFKSKEEKEQRRDQKVKRFLAQHGLDDLNPKSYQLVKNIMDQKTPSDQLFFESAAFFHGDGFQNTLVTDLDALIEQNWLLIKQNDMIYSQNKIIAKLLEDKQSQ
ncbi:hypothetical protein LBSG162_23680 [Lentilactobacillus buchneri subsp. silagei]|uniref:Uncharacterized protein n=1 Tax=Secundilactobacillus paracollinoides TaxID=240427 RepID=A0A1B2J2P5_9LACO|nr:MULTISPECIES: hypothetical protein [Lactobacillaceae]ANZ68553.1 hypothetical protein AYR63_15475 [Secundilactobacillus paracollinoides]BEJ53997.1 hypothetical protein Ltb232_21730 [Lentilactobacillus buchneri subsp. silagei]GED93263.1 hypothetical protein LBSG162_23680 [Lentilactobacillus buchneri subsp. silagei]